MAQFWATVWSGSIDGPHCAELSYPEEPNMSKVVVAGVGVIPFTKPGKNQTYPEMAVSAVHAVLSDAGVDYRSVQQAYVGYIYGDSTCGQRALYDVGMTGIPVLNVHNNCATGSSALFLARQAGASAVG